MGIMTQFKNSKKQGDFGLAKAIAWFAEQGYTVSLPLTDSQDYDLVVDMDGVLSRVQVKTGTQVSKNGLGIIALAVSGGNRSMMTTKLPKDQLWDYFFGYHVETKEILFISKSDLKCQRQIRLGDKYREWIST